MTEPSVENLLQRRITVSESYTISAKDARELAFKRNTDKMMEDIFRSIRTQCGFARTRLDVHTKDVMEGCRSGQEEQLLPHTKEIIAKLRNLGYQVELVYSPGGHGGPTSSYLKIEW